MVSMVGKSIRKWWALFTLPTLAAFIVGFLAPFAIGVYLSFCEFTTVSDAKFVGFKNYTKIFEDGTFLHSLWFTVAFTIVTTIIINVASFAVAYMLTKAFRGATYSDPFSSCRTSSAASF